MENEERNKRPEEPKNTTPTIVLIVLFGIVLLLLYSGWSLMSDDSSQITDMKEIEQVDTDLISSANSQKEPEVKQVTVAETNAGKVAASEVETKVQPEEKVVEKKPLPKASYSGETAVHTVKSGETFFKIAKNFNTNTDLLSALNPDLEPSNIKVGITKVNVPVQTVHTVGPGDVLRVVAGKYGITKEALMAANNKDRDFSQRGEKLLIPHKTKI